MRASCKSKRCRKFVTVSGIDKNLLFKNHKNSLKMEISTKNFIKTDLFLNFLHKDSIFWGPNGLKGERVKLEVIHGRTLVQFWKTPAFKNQISVFFGGQIEFKVKLKGHLRAIKGRTLVKLSNLYQRGFVWELFNIFLLTCLLPNVAS